MRTLLFILFASPAFAAFSLVNSVAVESVGGANVTTTAASFSGSNLLVACVAYFGNGNNATISDSSSNTWTGLTIYGNVGTFPLQILYVQNPTVTGSQTFSASFASNGFSSLFVMGFSGAATSSVFDPGPPTTDVGNSSSSTITSIQPGSITPNEANALVITCLNTESTSTPSVSVGFTIPSPASGSNPTALSSGNNTGGGMAYQIQTSATAVNPTWSFGSNQPNTAAIAAFKPGAGGGATPTGAKTKKLLKLDF